MMGAAGPVRELLGRAVALTAITAAASVAVAAVLRGRTGAVSAVAGGVLVLAFLLVGQLPVHQAGRDRRRVGAALLVILYAVRVLLCVAVFAAVTAGDRPNLDRRVLGGTVLACALVWTAGTVWTALRWRPVVVVPDSGRQQ